MANVRPDPAWRWACIALGSNIAPARYLPWAVQCVAHLGRRAWVSSAWQSAPVGFLDQADFINAAILLETRHAAEPLRRWLKQIEERLGRRRDPGNKNAPRTIDLDLVAYNQQALLLRDAVLPDPEIPSRPFLAVPLAEAAGELRAAPHWPSFQTLAQTFHGSAAKLQRRRDISLRKGSAGGLVASDLDYRDVVSTPFVSAASDRSQPTAG